MICCVELQDRTRSLKICKSRLRTMIIFDSFWSFRLRMLWLFLQCIQKIRMSLLQLKHAFLWCCLRSCSLHFLMSFCLRSRLIRFCQWLLLSSHLQRWSRSLSSKKWRTFHSHLIHFCWWLLLSSHLWRWSRNLSLRRWRMQWALIWVSYLIHSVSTIACACLCYLTNSCKSLLSSIFKFSRKWKLNDTHIIWNSWVIHVLISASANDFFKLLSRVLTRMIEQESLVFLFFFSF